ncbi:hypothetical protein Pla144_50920 [Bythopirellula polymerisocia]|uniref:Uncharacterized protein n=1 Tax=Bythopirellula polymerisocia TaxID=2528003 RepID=A0A5C6C0J0_9BACT|nr:hypothetical protein Pla144_50920 [Bythopirellula polymerisocia]
MVRSKQTAHVQGLPFESRKEQLRIERVERILCKVKGVETVARYFDEKAYREATVIAQRTNPNPRSTNNGT